MFFAVVTFILALTAGQSIFGAATVRVRPKTK